mgnify:FL=1
MFIEGAKEIIHNQMHTRIPNGSIKRNQWLNLCIDMQSFANECCSYQNKGNNGGQSNTNNFKCLE